MEAVIIGFPKAIQAVKTTVSVWFATAGRMRTYTVSHLTGKVELCLSLNIGDITSDNISRLNLHDELLLTQETLLDQLFITYYGQLMKPDPSKICFGLSEDLDKQSLAMFLRLTGTPEFADLFSSRLSSEEILKLTDDFTALMRKHLSENEYHQYFLGETDHHHEE